jgi:hypothetical protein
MRTCGMCKHFDRDFEDTIGYCRWPPEQPPWVISIEGWDTAEFDNAQADDCPCFAPIPCPECRGDGVTDVLTYTNGDACCSVCRACCGTGVKPAEVKP